MRQPPVSWFWACSIKNTADCGAADVRILAHAEGLAQCDGRQAVGIHGLRGASGQVALGGLLLDEPEQAPLDRVAIRSGSLVGLTGSQVGEDGQGSGAGVFLRSL